MNSLYCVTRGVLRGILRGLVPPGSSNPDPISDKKNAIFHIRFQTWLHVYIGRNNVIIVRLKHGHRMASIKIS